MRWKIHYDDGRTFSDRDGEPCDAPSYGALVVVQQHDGRLGILNAQWPNKGYYINIEGEWQAADSFDIIDLCSTRLREIRGVVIGRLVTNREFEQALKRAQNDPDFDRG